MITDISGRIIRKLRQKRLRCNEFVSGLIMTIELKIRGVKFGKKNIFNDRAIFSRYPDSSIIIGNNCRFVSDSSYNLAGVYRKCTISTLRKNAMIIIGNNSGMSGSVIGAAKKIVIGNNVLIGANVFISDFDWHNIDSKIRRQPCESSSPVIIEDNVWLGLNSIILKGVRIGENSVIGANSVVTRDIPPNVIAAGNPCKVIRSLKQ